METQHRLLPVTQQHPPALVPAKILLVEDRPAEVQTLEAILAGSGQVLVSVSSGEEAMRRLLKEEFAVILLDVQLSGLGGFETACLIRGHEHSRPTPIIFLSAAEPPGFAIAEAYKLGSIDYLVKPLVPEILRAKVAGFIELFRKTERLRHMERKDFEHRLAEDRHHWEVEHMHQEASRTDAFLAVLGHELRNPLAPICQAARALQLLNSPDPRVQQACQVIVRQAQHLTRLVDDLLDVSRIRRGKLKLCKELVRLDQIVSRSVETSRPFIEAHRHQLSVVLPANEVWLDGDLIRLAQVLANLLNNAAKYTEQGGQIRLSGGMEGNEVVLRVRDSGVGIAPEMLPRIFNLFAQAERSLEQAQGGLGIGLTLVRQIIQMHGGRVEAHSAGLAKGSEFVVHLPAPVVARACREERTGPTAATSPGRPRRILVVDDNGDAAESLATLLGLLGHEMQTVSNALDALTTARAWQPEVVLLDIGLPDITGYEVARLLRQEPGLETVLLVALTGYSQEDEQQRSRAAGFDFHLVKPIDFERLQAVLNSEPSQEAKVCADGLQERNKEPGSLA